MRNKKGLEFGFNWIFAIIAGAVILFAAIYATTKLIGTESTVSDTFIAAKLSNLLNPIETNLEDSKYVKISFNEETRIYNECGELGNFGKQQISAASKIGSNGEFGEKSVRKSSFNKYLFSRNYEQGKELNIIIKPFEFPYKIADIDIIYSGDYCFINPPTNIEEEINDLSADGAINIGINISNELRNCPFNSVIVCFDQLGCDVTVNTLSKIVSKNGEDVYYEGNLLYGAIFSNSELYECQVKRLMKRTSELASLYLGKSQKVSSRGCYSSNMDGELTVYANLTLGLKDSLDLREISISTKNLGDKNEILSCRLF